MSGSKVTVAHISYLTIIALSLFLFNLLPLPHTDGAHLLQAFLQRRRTVASTPMDSEHPVRATVYSHDDQYALEPERGYGSSEEEDEYVAEEGGRRAQHETVRERRLRRGIEVTTSVTLALWVGGWANLALLRSS